MCDGFIATLKRTDRSASLPIAQRGANSWPSGLPLADRIPKKAVDSERSCAVLVAHRMSASSGFVLLWAGWASRRLVHAVRSVAPPSGFKRRVFHYGCPERAFGVVEADAARSVENGVRAVGIDVRLTRALTKCARIGLSGSAVSACGTRRNCRADLPLLLNAQDLVEIDAGNRREGRAFAGGLNRKAGVVFRQIAVADEGVGRLHIG